MILNYKYLSFNCFQFFLNYFLTIVAIETSNFAISFINLYFCLLQFE
jgi:hypothetical protein